MSASLVVAIDGPAGVGKGTVARRLARLLGLPYLDTGAMYRAVALHALRHGIDAADSAAVEAILGACRLELAAAGSTVTVRLDGEPVEEAIRRPEVGTAASRVAAVPAVRRRLVEIQRRFGREHGAVMEGRDIGTVVFPDTPFKFFLDARLEVRTERRFRQLGGVASSVTREEVEEELRRRDARDRERTESPLRCDDSYTRVDTSELGVEEVVERLAAVIRSSSEARSG